jgi:hypothetical protein
MPEHRQRKGRLGDEHVAGHELERRAGRVGHILIVARGDDAQAIVLEIMTFDRDLRRAEDMAGGMKRDRHAVYGDAFAIADGLRRAGKILAIAQPHQIERFPRGQHRAVAGAGMVGMGMRNQRPLDNPRRVDMKAARLAAQAGRRRHQDVFRTHCQS